MCRYANSDDGASFVKPRQVLPKSLKPNHYNLTLIPGIETFEFSGKVSISLDVVETVKSVVLNAKELKITEASAVLFRAPAGSPSTTPMWPLESVLKLPKQNAVSIGYQPEVETITIDFEYEILEGSNIILHIEYEGHHNDKMAGWYRAPYVDEHGVKRHVVSTQFEPADARRAFPCFDEPALKATFAISLCVPQGLVGLSNMPIAEEKEVQIGDKPFTVLNFETTPIMSTYLVAFCVGDFDYVEGFATIDSKKVICRTYTLRGKKELGRFALDTGIKVLEFFSEFFDIPYPLTKLDQIAVPAFSMGAMENWGLLTYRESYLLYDPAKDSASAQEDVADTVAHEIAHQWFGNLVSPEWWDNLWLKEGFATFIGTLAVDHLFPKWNHFTGFLESYVSRALEHDSLDSSHPIQVPVSSPADVEQIFDAISYNKGASLIRQLESFLGKEVFRQGLSAYLKKHAYGNTVNDDLWDALTKASGHDISKMMKNWILEMGYPVITITKEEFNKETSELTLFIKQQKFSASYSSNSSSGPVWVVPISVSTHLGKVTRHLFSESSGTLTFPYSESDDAFFKLNSDAYGFYRVNYSRSQIERIGKAVEKSTDLLTVKDRIELVGDVFAIAKSGMGGTDVALELVRRMKHEDDGIVLSEIEGNLALLQATFFHDKDITAKIDELTLSIFAPKVSTYGYDYDDDYLSAKKRTLVISSCASAGSKEVIEELKNRFQRYLNGDKAAINANLFNIVYTTILKTTQDPLKDFNLVLEIYKDPSISLTEKMAALRSLGAVKDLKLVEGLLNELVLDFDLVKQQDIGYALVGVLSNEEKQKAMDLRWKWFTTNFDKICSLLDPKEYPIGVMRSFIGSEYVDMIQAWMSYRVEKVKPRERDIKIALETIRSRTAWYERDRELVSKWFALA